MDELKDRCQERSCRVDVSDHTCRDSSFLMIIWKLARERSETRAQQPAVSGYTPLRSSFRGLRCGAPRASRSLLCNAGAVITVKPARCARHPPRARATVYITQCRKQLFAQRNVSTTVNTPTTSTLNNNRPSCFEFGALPLTALPAVRLCVVRLYSCSD